MRDARPFELEPFHPLTESVIGAAIEVQKRLGPWLLEKAYETCLAHELQLRGHRVQRQLGLGIRYKDLEIPNAFRLDLLVDDVLIVELKVVDQLIEEHEAQLLSYLRFARKPVGLLLNFAAQPIGKKGTRRFVLSDPFSASSA